MGQQWDELVIEMIIPFDVTELFFRAVNSDFEIEDWMDFYGESEHKDFREELEEKLSPLANGKLRVTPNQKTVMYEDNGWHYFFGDYRDS